ncbi:hypothetical protein DFH09DRAFT_984664 [Mycena vulgaris]|nr:hypothetical protein DFH09DRAFT_984664 [Mycena vulgaris]
MATIAKTIVATGTSSGLGFEAIKQLLQQAKQPYKFFLGARNAEKIQAAYDALKYDSATHSVAVLPLELTDLRSVKTFAAQALAKLGAEKLDYVLLNAAVSKGATGPGLNGSKWCEAYIVNHLSQHYLLHLLRDKLVASSARVVVVSSGVVRNVRDKDPTTLDVDLLADSGANGRVIYSGTKFVQLVGAYHWRSTLKQNCPVIAVSPGFVPLTGLSRNSPEMKLTMDMPDARTVADGAKSILAALERTDVPTDGLDQLFFTSWGEWWPKEEYGLSLDKTLWEKWCPSRGQIEAEFKLLD